MSVLFGDGCLYLPSGTTVEKRGEVFFSIPIGSENKTGAAPKEIKDDKATVNEDQGL